jgi:hypothetical protein
VRTFAPGDRCRHVEARVRLPDPHLLPVRARLHGFTDYVIEVNPRHVAFYQRMLGFADFGGERPAAGSARRPCCCACRSTEMGAQIRRWGGS